MLFPSPINPWWNKNGADSYLLPGTIGRGFFLFLDDHFSSMCWQCKFSLHIDDIQGVLICCHLVVLMSCVCYIPWGSGSSGMEGCMSFKSGVCPCTTMKFAFENIWGRKKQFSSQKSSVGTGREPHRAETPAQKTLFSSRINQDSPLKVCIECGYPQLHQLIVRPRALNGITPSNQEQNWPPA